MMNESVMAFTRSWAWPVLPFVPVHDFEYPKDLEESGEPVKTLLSISKRLKDLETVFHSLPRKTILSLPINSIQLEISHYPITDFRRCSRRIESS